MIEIKITENFGVELNLPGCYRHIQFDSMEKAIEFKNSLTYRLDPKKYICRYYIELVSTIQSFSIQLTTGYTTKTKALKAVEILNKELKENL